MGSCVGKTPRNAQRTNGSRRVFAIQLLASNLEYLSPEVRSQIFQAKDSNPPILHLETNKLYLKRILQVKTQQYFQQHNIEQIKLIT